LLAESCNKEPGPYNVVDVDCLGILINALDRDPRFGHLTAAIRMNIPTWANIKRAIIRSEANSEIPSVSSLERSNYAGVEEPEEICQICGIPGHLARNTFIVIKEAETKVAAAEVAEANHQE
jgi:hypothetical protein